LTPEEAVIGACILDPNVIREAVKVVMPSDFETWQGEEVFSAIIKLHSTGRPVDMMTVIAELAAQKSRVPAGDLHRIIAEVPTSSNVTYYAEMVRESATRRRLTRTGQKLVQYANDPSTLPGAVLADAIKELKAAREDSPTSSLTGTTLGELMAQPDSYDWVIKGLFESGDRYMLTGNEGAGKSMLVKQIAVFAAAGIHPFWLYDIPPVDVVVIDRENSERQWRRKARPLFDAARAVGKGDPGSLYIENNLGDFDITKDRDLGYIHRVLDHNPCKILAIGPLYKLIPRAIKTDDDAAPLLAALDSLRNRGCVIITEAHAGNERSSSLRPVGSSAFMRWPEFGHGLRADEVQENRYMIERWRGDRDERPFPSALYRRGRGDSAGVPWVAENVAEGLLSRMLNPGTLVDEGGKAIGF
jgi:hypothetical protein